MSNRTSKLKQELLFPGDKGWELWSGPPAGRLERVKEFDDRPGTFAASAARRTLALPAASLWVLPAWLQGERSFLRDMARLHLERLGVRAPEHDEALAIESLVEGEGSHLSRIVALKDVATPLSDFRVLPEVCQLSASCYTLASDSITLWRELGRLVVAITIGERLAYFSPMSASTLDQHGLAELNNICLQLTFQRVITSLSAIVLWIDDGDAERIQRLTGLEVRRQDKPVPDLLTEVHSTLMPADIIATRIAAHSATKRRTMALAAGFALAAAIAGFSVLMTIATRERDGLRETIAEITPRAARVANHKAAWTEAAPAVDPEQYPMELLLRCMSPKGASDIALSSFDCTPERIVVQGRAMEISSALKYSEQIKNSDDLVAYQWEASTPSINEQTGTTTFELKGTLPEAQARP